VTRASGVNLAHVTQMLRAKFAYDVRHVARVHHANVAGTCRARSAQQGMLLKEWLSFNTILYPSEQCKEKGLASHERGRIYSGPFVHKIVARYKWLGLKLF
jgi:hypothetical protein